MPLGFEKLAGMVVVTKADSFGFEASDNRTSIIQPPAVAIVSGGVGVLGNGADRAVIAIQRLVVGDLLVQVVAQTVPSAMGGDAAQVGVVEHGLRHLGRHRRGFAAHAADGRKLHRRIADVGYTLQRFRKIVCSECEITQGEQLNCQFFFHVFLERCYWADFFSRIGATQMPFGRTM